MDPVAIIGAISAGLNLIDKFRSLALTVMKKEGGTPSVHAEEKNGAMEIQRNGHVDKRITASQVIMSAWDEKRYKTLERKVSLNWDIFNDIDGELPMASADEKARLRAKLESIKSELCKDFREMLTLYEKALGTHLGDHYSLYSVCGVS